ncbi:hypothetical protein ACJMK2_039839 [Sinanodonta woodiana]|uniref:Uncharacterized protein n=1 Tax=Sinanodonta woodiana TaxID=1069815 RepID=A0ABD3WGN5_SINWO
MESNHEEISKKKHNKLLIELNDYINITDQGYKNFITFLRNTYLPPGALSRVENEPCKLFQLMEQKGLLRVGDYKVLEEALGASGNNEASALVRRLGSEVIQHVTGQGLTTIATEETAQESVESSTKRVKPDRKDSIGEPEILYYDRENKEGFLLILNFTKGREGTEFDVTNLKKFFKDTLKFHVVDPRQDRANDFSLSELNGILEKTRSDLNDQAKKYYCFFCAILSHGNEKGIQCDDGHHKDVDEIRKTFTNDKMKNFVGKPRVFLIQACRGQATQQAHDMPDDWPADISNVTGKISHPTDADVFIAYATTPGNLAWRRSNVGSWFIHVTISVFEERYKSEHMEDMFISVKNEIAKDDKWKNADGRKMMPCTWSTLTQRLMF